MDNTFHLNITETLEDLGFTCTENKFTKTISRAQQVFINGAPLDTRPEVRDIIITYMGKGDIDDTPLYFYHFATGGHSFTDAFYEGEERLFIKQVHELLRI